jgi:hypothetical protein
MCGSIIAAVNLQNLQPFFDHFGGLRKTVAGIDERANWRIEPGTVILEIGWASAENFFQKTVIVSRNAYFRSQIALLSTSGG